MASPTSPSDSSGLGRIMSKQAFDPENFVNKLSQGGEDDLEEMRKKVHTLAEDTAIALKKNVYKNYSQFIETAKEISILEGEMYQLSHMLTDQKSVLSAMMELSITGNKIETPDEPDGPHPKEEGPEKNLARLLEKVEGCSSVTEVPGRRLIFDGHLAELDPESFTTVGKIHIFLLNDSLMITSWLPHRRGPVKYKFQTLYELDSLAVVNARDVGPCKNAFKILMFPDTRMFQADNPKTKRQWLDVLEETKKKKAAADSQRKEAAAAAAAESRNSSTRNSSVRTSARMSTTSSTSFDSLNPFGDDLDEDGADSRPMSAVMEADLLHEDWLQELPEDLDVCIAQRDFEGAVDLIDKVNEFLEELPRSAAVREYKARIDSRIKQLTDVLVNELQASPERSLRGGPRAARRAVTQLIRLGKSAQACTLFLNHRSAIIKHSLLQLKIEGATTLYIKKLCDVFFTGLMETGQEFTKAFPDNYGCFSAFVIWSKSELQTFVKTFTSQVFVSKATLTMVAECVSEARKRCDQLSSIGLELTFVLDTQILPDLEKVLKDAADLQVEAIRHRASKSDHHVFVKPTCYHRFLDEKHFLFAVPFLPPANEVWGKEDVWRPVNFMNLETTERFEEEMMDFGLLNIHNYTYDECFTALSTTTIQFTRSYLTFCNDCMKVYMQELHVFVTGALVKILKAQLHHAEQSAKSQKFSKENIVKNATFLVENLLPVVKDKYQDKTNQQLPNTHDLTLTLAKIKRALKETLGEFV